MEIHQFTEEQVEMLNANPYVKKCSCKEITYSEEFKELFYKEYCNGKAPSRIFRECGFDISVIGQNRVDKFVSRIKKNANRPERFADTRKGSSGRPRTRELSLEEQLEYLKHKNEILQQENSFLKSVQFLNKKQNCERQKKKNQENDSN